MPFHIIRWILLPIISTIWTIVVFLLWGYLISYLLKITHAWDFVWWTNILITWFQWALMWFLAFWIPFKIAPKYKVKAGMLFVVLFSIFGIIMPLFMILNFIFGFYPALSRLDNLTSHTSFNLILNLLSQFAQIIWFIIGSYYIYNEKKSD